MGVKQTSALGLEGLAERMSGVGSTAFRRRVAANLAEEARTQVARGFAEERNPYGVPWAPIQREGKILQSSGRLRASVATQASANGFRIDMPVVYAAIHQYGARKRAKGKKRGNAQGGIQQRQMIPMTSTGGLGPIWQAAFNEAVSGLLDAAARGG